MSDKQDPKYGDPITFRPTKPDELVIAGIRAYLLEQQMHPSAGNMSDAMRFALHLTGMCLHMLSDNPDKPPRALVTLLQSCHAALADLENL